MKFLISTVDKYKIGVYCITNLVNNKTYIGSTGNSFYNRYHQHISDYKKNKHNGVALKRAFDKYRIENFSFSIVCICEESERLPLEQHYINQGTDYNSVKIAGSMLGYKHPPTSRTRTVIGGRHHSAVAVDQYRLSGEFVRSFDCVTDAINNVRLVSRSGIIQACKGKVYSAGKFRWAYKNMNLPQRPNRLGTNAVEISKGPTTLRFNSQLAASNHIKSMGFKCHQGRFPRALKSGEKIYGFTIKKIS